MGGINAKCSMGAATTALVWEARHLVVPYGPVESGDRIPWSITVSLDLCHPSSGTPEFYQGNIGNECWCIDNVTAPFDSVHH
jgi:hypothetical protein